MKLTHDSITLGPARRGWLSLLALVSGLALVGCGREVESAAEVDEDQPGYVTSEEGVAQEEGLSVTRGDTGVDPDPGSDGMFATGTEPGETEEVEPVTEEWSGSAFGQEHESAYTTEAEERVPAE